MTGNILKVYNSESFQKDVRMITRSNLLHVITMNMVCVRHTYTMVVDVPQADLFSFIVIPVTVNSAVVISYVIKI